MVASYADEGGSFRADKPRLWSQTRFSPRFGNTNQYPYALHPDGDRFAVALENATDSGQAKLVFVFNFFEELRRIAPAATR